MISKKIFIADGKNARFLSEFIIASEQFARVYVYIYDNTLNPNGSEDELENGSTDQNDWDFPNNLWKRGDNAPNSGDDLITIDKWSLVTNSILFFKKPKNLSTVWIEVATTSEEFGDTLIQPQVAQAEAAASAALVSANNAAADAILTAADVVSTNADVVATQTLVDEFSAIKGTSVREGFTATEGQTTFTPAIPYNPSIADVYLNGTKLLNDVDVDVSSGTDIVLTEGATVGDVVDVTAYGIFAVADTYTKAEVDAQIDLSTWTIEESGGVIYFKVSGVNKAKLDASGNLTVTGDVTPNGTV